MGKIKSEFGIDALQMEKYAEIIQKRIVCVKDFNPETDRRQHAGFAKSLSVQDLTFPQNSDRMEEAESGKKHIRRMDSGMSELQELFEKSVNSPHDAAFKAAFKKLTVARGFFQTWLPKRIREHIDFDSLEITDGTYTNT